MPFSDEIMRKTLGRPDFFRSGPAMLEAVDVVFGVGDGGVRIAPGEADFKGGKGVVADHQRPVVVAADAGVPEVASGFERLDPVTLVEAIHLVSPRCRSEETMNQEGNM
jgi:hypothetical protein